MGLFNYPDYVGFPILGFLNILPFSFAAFATVVLLFGERPYFLLVCNLCEISTTSVFLSTLLLWFILLFVKNIQCLSLKGPSLLEYSMPRPTDLKLSCVSCFGK